MNDPALPGRPSRSPSFDHLSCPGPTEPAVRCLGDILAASVTPPECLLGTWLTEGHLNMTYAEAGVGKSMFALAVGLAVAGGGEVFGWTARRPRPVLLIDGEMEGREIRERAMTLLEAAPSGDHEAAARNLKVMAYQDQPDGAPFPDVATPEGHRTVIDAAVREGAALVILDNFSTLATVEDENAASAFNPVLTLLRELKRRGIAVVLIHHSRKAGNRNGSYRGSQKMAVVFNSIIRLEHPGGKPGVGGTAFALEWEKVRGLRDHQTRPFRASLEEDALGRSEWVLEGRCGLAGGTRSAAGFELVQLVRTRRFATQAALAAAMGRSPGWVTKHRDKAIDWGLITLEEWKACLGTADASTAAPHVFPMTPATEVGS